MITPERSLIAQSQKLVTAYTRPRRERLTGNEIFLVYHISFKKYPGIEMLKQKPLEYMSIVNSASLFLLNIVFTYLAVKLYKEYGWKIYKRVRFNIKLRAAYHVYELVICLLKMVVLFITMFGICMNLTILKGKYDSFNYIVGLVSIPLAIILAVMGVIAIRREIRILMSVYLVFVFSGLVYYTFKICRVIADTCYGCKEFRDLKDKDDIHDEVILHVLYLGLVCMIFLILLLLASLRACKNFNKGLAKHFAPDHTKTTNVALSLSHDVLASIIPTSCEDISTAVVIGEQMNKAGVSHEPRPSIFDHLPAVSTFAGRRHSHTNPESDDYIDTHTKSSSLPMRDHSKRRLSERIRKGAKNRISQLFWETEYGRQSGSSSSVASSRLALAEKCCPCVQWLKAGRLSNMSVYTSSTRKFNTDVFVNEATMERQGTKTYEENSTDTENSVISVPSPVPNGRGTSLPTDDFCHSGTVITNRSDVARRSSDRFVRSYSTGSRPIDFELHLGGNAIPEEIDSCTSEGPLAVFTENKALPPLRCSRPQSSDLLQDKRHLNSATITVPDTVEEREIKDAIQICNTNNSDVSRRSSTSDIALLSRKISDDILITPTSSWDRKSKTPVRRTRSSIASISSYSSNKTDFSDVGTESSNFSLPASVPDSPTADRKLDVVFETQTEEIKKAASDWELYLQREFEREEIREPVENQMC